MSPVIAEIGQLFRRDRQRLEVHEAVFPRFKGHSAAVGFNAVAGSETRTTEVFPNPGLVSIGCEGMRWIGCDRWHGER